MYNCLKTLHGDILLETISTTSPYPLFDGEAFKINDTKKRIEHIKLAENKYESELAKGKLKATVMTVMALASVVLSGGCFLLGAYGILTAAVSLTTVGMGDAAIKLLASFVFLLMAGSAMTRETPQQQLDLTDPQNWKKIHSWLGEYRAYRLHLQNAGLTIKTLHDIGFINKTEPYDEYDQPVNSARALSPKDFFAKCNEANIKLKIHQATLINP